MSDDEREWRLRVYRSLRTDLPLFDQPLECIVDVPLGEQDKIDGMDLTGTHGSIEPATQPPAKTLREIVENGERRRGAVH